MVHRNPRRRFRPVLLSTFLLLSCSAAAQSDPYHILITNDDGIESPGIQALADELRGVGEVLVVAPCGERSGSSMSISLRDELRVRPVERNGQVVGHCVNATPAGAVLLAATMLAPEGGFDLVVSGITRGANVGVVAHMSGTVGGAMMGALHGIPAVAASLGGRAAAFEYSARFVAAFVEELKGRPALPGIVFSINIPKATEAEIGGVTLAKMGGNYLRIGYEEVQDVGEGRLFRPSIGLETTFPEETDTDGFMHDMITITPLAFDWTAYGVLDDVRGWGLSHKVTR